MHGSGPSRAPFVAGKKQAAGFDSHNGSQFQGEHSLLVPMHEQAAANLPNWVGKMIKRNGGGGEVRKVRILFISDCAPVLKIRKRQLMHI